MRSHLPRLCCPRCHLELARVADGWRCDNASCSIDERVFTAVNGVPVIIDHERSIVRHGDVESWAGTGGVPRQRHIWWQRARRVFLGAGVTAPYMQRFHSRITADARAKGLPAKVLIVGGGAHGPGVSAMAADAELSLTCTDIYGSPLVDVICDAHGLPFADGSFDAALIQSVLEHVLSPDAVVAELHRVLRRDGLLLSDTPFLLPVHEGPYDFTRFTHSGLRWLFRGFEEDESGATGGSGTALVWSIEQFVASVTRSRLWGKIAKAAVSWLRLFDRVAPEAQNIDGAASCYFVGRRSDVVVHPAAMPRYYRGAQ